MLVGGRGRKVLELMGTGLIWRIEAEEEEGVLEEKRRVCLG